MLVLSRQRNEKIVICLPKGVLITITVVDIRGIKARLGFTAPPDIPIHRKEVYEALLAENPDTPVCSLAKQESEGGMLVLSRERDPEVVMVLPDGTLITITVVDIRGEKVRIGTDAPKELPVHRYEIWEAIQREEAQRRVAETPGTQGSVG